MLASPFRDNRLRFTTLMRLRAAANDSNGPETRMKNIGNGEGPVAVRNARGLTRRAVLLSCWRTSHPMTEEHWIMWIELVCKDNCYKRKFLKPGDEPKAKFVVADTSGIWAREYCNIHGLWKYT